MEKIITIANEGKDLLLGATKTQKGIMVATHVLAATVGNYLGIKKPDLSRKINIICGVEKAGKAAKRKIVAMTPKAQEVVEAVEEAVEVAVEA